MAQYMQQNFYYQYAFVFLPSVNDWFIQLRCGEDICLRKI